MNYSYSDLAKMIDHSLLHPTMTDKDLEDGCKVAAKYQVASVCIKPYAVKQAVEWLRGSGVLVGAVIGFPHGNSTTESKRYETELACKDGAAEIDMVINIGKALGGDWDYVEADVKAVCDEAHKHGAKVKVIFENDYLTQGGAGLSSDDFKIKLCQLCERAGADWVKTSSGYGFVKQPDGSYNYKGATEHDLALMRASVSAESPGQSRRWRARSRRPHQSPRPRRFPLRCHGDSDDDGRLPQTRSSRHAGLRRWENRRGRVLMPEAFDSQF
jgi:deoxyribose-phosphate aldolase